MEDTLPPSPPRLVRSTGLNNFIPNNQEDFFVHGVEPLPVSDSSEDVQLRTITLHAVRMEEGKFREVKERLATIEAEDLFLVAAFQTTWRPNLEVVLMDGLLGPDLALLRVDPAVDMNDIVEFHTRYNAFEIADGSYIVRRCSRKDCRDMEVCQSHVESLLGVDLTNLHTQGLL